MQTKDISKDIVVFYHGQCFDGFGGAYTAWKKFGEGADYFPLQWTNPAIPEVSGKEVYFIDFTPSKKILEELKKNNKVIGIDHHISAKDEIEILDEKVFSIDNSGAYLAWQYFHQNEKMPELIKHISDYDTWQFKLDGTREINLYLDSKPFEFLVYDSICKQLETTEGKKEIVKIGKIISEYRDNIRDEIIQMTIRRVFFEGHEVYAVNSPILNSNIGSYLYEKHPPFAIIWSANRDALRVSLRGNGEIDLSRLAEKYGGGGHHNAAGFALPKNSELPWKEIE